MAKKNEAKGKWGAVSTKEITDLKFDPNEGSYCTKVTFTFKHASSVTTKWEPEDSSLRIYYRKYSIATGEPIEEAEHDDILPVDCLYYGKYGKATKVVYKITGFEYEAGVYYQFNIWLRVYNYTIEAVSGESSAIITNVIPTTLKKTYKAGREKHYFVIPSTPTPTPAPVVEYGCNDPQPLFKIARYSWSAVDGFYVKDFVDFTDCITLPSYEVSREDVNESWDDANYDQHILVPTRKIKGKFSMLFPSMERYNEFMYYVNTAKQLNEWSPNACVVLYVQINNELDYTYKYVDAQHAAPLHEQGNFTIKIDSNPWIKPVVGHFDRYSPINVTIEQVDSDMNN